MNEVIAHGGDFWLILTSVSVGYIVAYVVRMVDESKKRVSKENDE